MKKSIILLVSLSSFYCIYSHASTFSPSKMDSEKVIVNGVPWYDSDGNIINAHGAGIVEDSGRFWLFGEYKSDGSNAFPGFGCYSSPDLVNWQFERVVLPVQPDGILGPERVGERVKVMRCPSTGKYVMFMHADNLQYNDPNIGVAIADSINGDYTLLGTIEYDGKPLKKWDMGTFQDEDGTGYLLIHHGPIYRLSDDYLSVAEKVADIKGMGESPAMFKKDGIYYLLSSNLTSWERNDNFYFTATDIRGPWEKQGLFCPEGTLTYNSQCTFVLPLKRNDEIIPMYMGDRWSYPLQASAATYVWLPMITNGLSLSIPEYWECWDIDKVKNINQEGSFIPLEWISDNPEESLDIPFHGSRIVLLGKTDPGNSYARLRITDREGYELQNNIVDFYSKAPTEGIRFVSKTLPEGDYTLTVTPTGIETVWYKKNGDRFGCTGTSVSLTGALIK